MTTRPGARGPAVEDIQKRLFQLGYDLGPTGVDGVFLGKTQEAVRAFQRDNRLVEDGVVGPHTWAALVDATFTLGDRLLYLKYPYFHGSDVRVLQGALNVLGFACGAVDGIFGAFTERAVREFQVNTGCPPDGIVGPETVRAVMRLAHVWADKDPSSPMAIAVAPARAADVLLSKKICVHYLDDQGRSIGERLANLAKATEPGASVEVTAEGGPSEADVVLHVGSKVLPSSVKVPVVVISQDGQDGIHARLVTALAGATGRPEVAIEVAEPLNGERELQQLAVHLLDAVCSVFG
ncbi:MAG: peptidoglycan-binding protein [Coriobacteriales bacterium]|nr:peptidoglycan-binding protein [Actinomycetes bacterium]